MDKRVQKSIQLSEALKKPLSALPWKPDEPYTQLPLTWDPEEEQWVPLPVAPGTSGQGREPRPPQISAVAVYNWNIDFMLPFPESRMAAAMAHMEKLLSQSPAAETTAAVINLQECIASDLITVSRQKWVRDNFYMTDIDASSWASGLYGTATLVDRRLSVSSCFRVHYSATQMERDVLFVDCQLPNSQKKLRLGNTHLESLVADPPLRPKQMQTVAQHMRQPDVTSAIVTGDFNAIQPFDRSLHAENGLKDAYLELGGREGGDEGYTWGQQALPDLRERFGCSRMDKVYYCGSGLSLQSFERFGADVEVDGADKDAQRAGLLALGFEKAWVTDHLGIKAVFGFRDLWHL